MRLTVDDTTQPITEWALDYGIPVTLIRSRLKRGWSEERAVTEPMIVRRGQKLPADAALDLAPKPPPVVPPLATPLARLPRPTSRERKGVRRYTHNNVSLTLGEWARRLGLREGTLRMRLRLNWPLEEVLTVETHTRRASQTRRPYGQVLDFAGRSMRVNEWADHLGIDKQVIRYRLRQGWPLHMVLDARLRQGGRSPVTHH